MGFTPPTEAQRLAAAGATAALSQLWRRALEPHTDFSPIPEPAPGDWLAAHPEAGQTFDQFVRSRPTRPDAGRTLLYLQPLENFSEREGPSLESLRQFTSAFFMLEARILPPIGAQEMPVTQRRNPWTGQPQLLTTDILRGLSRRRPSDAFAVVGVTMRDLSPDPSWNFVFGQASPAERVSVYSFIRYDPRFYGEAPSAESRRLMLRRSAKVLAHEAAHMFGLAHCVWYHCLMNGSNHLAESDARPLHLCPVDLRKLGWSVGFDVLQRYRRLRDFHREAGFEDEARWLDRRIEWIGLGAPGSQ